MPTADRRAFFAQSIWYFLRQDYSPRELIVVDDGDEDVAALIPEDERIRYVRQDGRRPLGEKLNVGCRLARGELIAHWDDDDWIGPDRLSRQVAVLEAGNADACGLSELLTYRLETGEAWLQRKEPAAPGTFVYRKDVWRRRPFPENGPQSDTELAQALDSKRLLRLEGADAQFYVALIHSGNAGRHTIPGRDWTTDSIANVSERLGIDRDFYVRLRNGGYVAKLRSGTTHTVTVAASFMVYDGYGSLAEYLVRGLARSGAVVNVAPFDLDTRGLSSEFREILDRSDPRATTPVLYCSWPRPELRRFRAAPDLFLNTMWETSRLPSDWPALLNDARAVIVPTRFVERVCRDSGVDVPIAVIPEGVDPEVYGYVERPEREGVTTLVVATFVERKNTHVAVAAWKRAFADDPTARLIVKARFGYGNYTPDDSRILLVDESEPTRGIAHWYERADVLLAVGSEGFGLPLVEAMATGLPAIALDSEGQGDTCADAEGLLLPVKPSTWREYADGTFGRCGVHGCPSVEDVADRLRWVATNRAEARAMGWAASEWVREERSVWSKPRQVLDVMEERVAPRRPLRRLPAMWVPSLGKPCGIAEHASRLAEQLETVELTADPPDLRRVRVLHVQHHGALYDDNQLTAVVREAKERRIPVVVEEHCVGPTAHAWERDADVLLATTAAGAAQLRRRWAGTWIEHLPLGCPTWFPPRKKTRGRVLGAYGLLEPHKGFWRLLELLPQLADAELLLVGHAKSAAQEERWRTDSEDLPVRRVAGFLPEREAAAVLAAEADVLVYWYDDTTLATASGAVRLGLSTGVPVLASPTSWFSDLRDVTFQPDALADGVHRLLGDERLRRHLTKSAQSFCHAHSWQRTAARIHALWRTLEST
jgi:glycosyltransferase involved in cell wall biosynthesis